MFHRNYFLSSDMIYKSTEYTQSGERFNIYYTGNGGEKSKKKNRELCKKRRRLFPPGATV